VNTAQPKKARKAKITLAPLSPTSRATLDKARPWLDDFRSFLENVLEDSEQNRRQVMKQATKLVSGEGVPHPRSSAVFMAGTAVKLGADFLELISMAVQWEKKYGEDYGHGWLLRHPLKKLHLYQAYVSRGGKKQQHMVDSSVEEVEASKVDAPPTVAQKPLGKQPRSQGRGSSKRIRLFGDAGKPIAPTAPDHIDCNDPLGLIQKNIKVYWPDYKKWFLGTVEVYYRSKNVYRVLYREDKMLTYDLHNLTKVPHKRV